MFLKQLINPKPTIILFFILFCIGISSIPMLNSSLEVVFLHDWVPASFVFLLSIIIPFFHALGLNNLVYEKNIIRKDNLVLGFVYILLCTPFCISISAWFISFFLLFYINYLFDSYQKDYPLSQIFNSSFILSILSFLNPTLLFLFFLVIVAGINYDNLSWRSLLTMVIGGVLPYLFYFSYTFLFHDAIFIIPDFKGFQGVPFNNYLDWSLEKYLWGGVVLLITLFSFLEIVNWLYKKSIRSRKSFVIVLFYFILCVCVILYSESSYYYIMSPLSIIIANYFTYTKSQKIANLLFVLFVLSSIYYKYLIAI